MPSSPSPDPFVVPDGIVFEQVDGALTLEHIGDIVLHGTLGMDLSRVRSTMGNITLHIDAELGELAAPAGTVTVYGSLRAESLLGRTIHVEGDLHAGGIYGDHIDVTGDVFATTITTGDGGVHIRGHARVEDEIDAAGGDVIIEGDVTAGSISASNGRVVVHGTLTAQSVTAEKGVEVSGNTKVGAIRSNGSVNLFEDVETKEIHAEHVRITGARAAVRITHGRVSIGIGATCLEAEILQAPTVNIDSAASGRVAVVECHNELGANAIKGCMSLADLEAVGMIADIDAYLQRRGLTRLGEPAMAEEDAPSADISLSPWSPRRPGGSEAPLTFVTRPASLPADRPVGKAQAPVRIDNNTESDEFIEQTDVAGTSPLGARAPAPRAAEEATTGKVGLASTDIEPPSAATEPALGPADVDALDPSDFGEINPIELALDEPSDEFSDGHFSEGDPSAVEWPLASEDDAHAFHNASYESGEFDSGRFGVIHQGALSDGLAEPADDPMPPARADEVPFTVGGNEATIEDLFPILPEEDEDEPPTNIAPGTHDPRALSDDLEAFEDLFDNDLEEHTEANHPTVVHGPGAATAPSSAAPSSAAPSSAAPSSAAPSSAATAKPAAAPSSAATAKPAAPPVARVEAVSVEEDPSDHGMRHAAPGVDLAAAAPAAADGHNGRSPGRDATRSESAGRESAPEPDPALRPAEVLADEVPDDEVLADAPEQDDAHEQDPVFMLMIETVGRIQGCYDEDDMPPAVSRLHSLVEGRAYEDIRTGISDIWNQLLKFHQKRGLRIQPQVTTTFNTINTIVSKL